MVLSILILLMRYTVHYSVYSTLYNILYYNHYTRYYRIAGNFRRNKFSRLLAYREKGYTIMANSRISFSRMLGQLRNLQKFCPAKISCYTVFFILYRWKHKQTQPTTPPTDITELNRDCVGKNVVSVIKTLHRNENKLVYVEGETIPTEYCTLE